MPTSPFIINSDPFGSGRNPFASEDAGGGGNPWGLGGDGNFLGGANPFSGPGNQTGAPNSGYPIDEDLNFNSNPFGNINTSLTGSFGNGDFPWDDLSVIGGGLSGANPFGGPGQTGNPYIPQINDPTIVGSLDGNGVPITTDGTGQVANINNQGVRIEDPSSIVVPPPGTPSNVSGGVQMPFPIPIPGIDPLTALGATLLLNNGLPTGGGSITNLPGAVSNVVSNPIGSVQSTVSNVSDQIMGPSVPGQNPIGSGIPIPVPWPSSNSGNAGAPPAPQPTTPTVSAPPTTQETGGWAVISGPGTNAPGPTGPNAPTNSAPPPPQETGNWPVITGPGVNVPATVGPNTPNQNNGNTNTVVTGGGGDGNNNQGGGGIFVSGPGVNVPATTGPNAPRTETPTNPVVPVTPTTPTTGVTVPPIVPLPTTMPTDTSVVAPTDRNFLREGTATNSDLNSILFGPNGLFSANGGYGRASGAAGQTDFTNWSDILRQFGGQNSNLTGLANDQTATSNTALRQNNLNDVQSLLGQATNLRNQANPDLLGPNGSLGTYNQGAGAFLRQAQQQQQDANFLSPQERNTAQQAARDAWGARGLINSPGAVGDEILNTDSLLRQRQQQAFLNTQGALGTYGQNVASQQQNIFDPFGAILGSQYGQQTNNAGSNQNLFGQSSSFSSGQQGNAYSQNITNPFNPYAQDVYGSNFNAENARNISASNNAAAAAGANTAASSSIASGFLSLLGNYYGNRGTGSCWVAREVFGENDIRWVQFRHWMLNVGPKWFRTLYLKHGEKFAAWLKLNPWLKPAIRAFMESRIKTLKTEEPSFAL